MGNTDVEDALRRLDRSTLEEAHVASLELLRISHNVEGRVICIGKGVQGVEDKVQRVDEGVQDARDAIQDVGDGVHDVRNAVQDVDDVAQVVREAVQDVDDKVQVVLDAVQDVGDGVQDVQQLIQGLDDKVGKANRESFPSVIDLTLHTHKPCQETTSENAFEFGSLLRTRPLIITWHATLNIRDQLNGSSMVPFLVNGNPLVQSCGYTESVRSSGSYSLCRKF